MATKGVRTINSYRLWKWALFGVALPLLPIVARFSAAWLDASERLPGFDSLFGDGELLVLATVVAAAGIGDLLFDVLAQPGRGSATSRLGAAWMSAYALVIVVLSVMFFGLVTFESQSRSSTVRQAEITNAALSRLDRLRAAETSLVQDRTRAAKELQQIRGQESTEDVRLRQRLAESRLRALEAELEDNRAEQRSAILDPTETLARDSLDTAESDQERGRHQTAVISIVMFGLSLVAGAGSVLVARRAFHPSISTVPAEPSELAPADGVAL